MEKFIQDDNILNIIHIQVQFNEQNHHLATKLIVPKVLNAERQLEPVHLIVI